jgi:threonine dehydratase
VVTLADIEAARTRIAGGVYYSPCVESIPLSQLTGAHIYCKLDYLQRTGQLQGARRAQRAAAALRGAAQARRHRRLRRQSLRRASRITRACSAFDNGRDAGVRRARSR